MSTDDALEQAETEEQQRRRVHATECAELLKRQFSNSEAYDKAILTLSSGLLALSLSFIKEILPARSITWTCLLYTSWASLTLAVVTTVISFRVSDAALNQGLEQRNRYYLEGDETAWAKTSLSRWVDRINNVAGVLFVIGVILTVIFVSLNFSETMNMSKTSGGGPTRFDEGHTVPTMQKVVVEPVKKGQSVPQMQQVIKPQPPAGNPATTPATQSPATNPPAAKK